MSDGARERVLVIGDDMRIFLTVVRSLGRAGKEVHVAPFDWHAPALSSRYVSKVHHIPRYSDSPAAWLECLLGILRTHSFALVVPCCDRAILPLHMHRAEFAAYPIAIPSAEAMDLLFDKECTRNLCHELNIPVVAGARLGEADTAAELAARFGLPLVIKPRRSFAADRLDAAGKVHIVDTAAELEALLGKLQDRPRYLVEAYFEGSGVGVSVLGQNGKVLQAFQHRRLREGRGGCSSYRISEPVNDELNAACAKIAERIVLNGVCMFEFRYNRGTHKWVLLETNARFWGSLPLPVSLGVDFPRFLLDLIAHRTTHAPAQYQLGIRSRNLVLDGHNLLSADAIRARGLGPWLADIGDFLAQPVRWSTGRERSDSFVRDDLRPAGWECVLLVRDIGRKVLRRWSPEPKRRRSEQAA